MRYSDKPGGILIVFVNTVGHLSFLLRFRGSQTSPVPQLHLLPEAHEKGPAILFEYDDPANVVETEKTLRTVIASLNSALEIEADPIKEAIKAVVASQTSAAQSRLDQADREKTKIEAEYQELPYDEAYSAAEVDDDHDAEVADPEELTDDDRHDVTVPAGEPADATSEGLRGEASGQQAGSFTPTRIVADKTQFLLINELIDTAVARLETLLDSSGDDLPEETVATIRGGVLPLLRLLKHEISRTAASAGELAELETEAGQTLNVARKTLRGVKEGAGWLGVARTAYDLSAPASAAVSHAIDQLGEIAALGFLPLA